MWVLLAFGSALFAGLTAILAKIGVRDVDSDVATALRTVVVLLFAWLMVGLNGSIHGIGALSVHTWVFLALSGMATGASWLCYYRALQLGNVNQVAPVDKTSTVLTMLLAFLLLGEGFTPLKAAAMVLIGTGAFLMARPTRAAAKAVFNSKQTAIADDGTSPAVLVQATVQEQRITTMLPTRSTFTDHDATNAGVTGNPLGASKKATWLPYAIGAALFASLTAILGKVGIRDVDSTLGTAIRTCVVLVMAWGIVFARGKGRDVTKPSRHSLLFLALSGLATGASWLCYYRALQMGPASVVVPIDKLSIVVSIAFSGLVLREKLTPRATAGLLLLVAGTLLLLL